MFAYLHGVAVTPNGRLVCVSWNYGLRIFYYVCFPDGTVCNSYKEAALKRGLLDDDQRLMSVYVKVPHVLCQENSCLQ